MCLVHNICGYIKYILRHIRLQSLIVLKNIKNKQHAWKQIIHWGDEILSKYNNYRPNCGKAPFTPNQRPEILHFNYTRNNKTNYYYYVNKIIQKTTLTWFIAHLTIIKRTYISIYICTCSLYIRQYLITHIHIQV